MTIKGVENLRETKKFSTAWHAECLNLSNKNPSSINCRKPFFGATSPKWSPLVPSSFAGRSSVVINAGQSRIFWNFGMNISQNLPQFCTQTASMLCRCNLDELCLVILIISLIQIPFDLFCYMAQNLACKCELAPRQILWVFYWGTKLSRARHYSKNDKNNQKS